MQINNLTIPYCPYNINEWATLSSFEIDDIGLLSFVRTPADNDKILYTLPYKEMAYIVLSEMINGNATYIGRIMEMCTKE